MNQPGTAIERLIETWPHAKAARVVHVMLGRSDAYRHCPGKRRFRRELLSDGLTEDEVDAVLHAGDHDYVSLTMVLDDLRGHVSSENACQGGQRSRAD